MEVATREGWYIPNTKETWLPWEHDKKIEYTHTESASVCRIKFNVLKKRYDANGKDWNGVTTWQI